MLESMRRFFSVDDLWSVLGFILLVVLGRVFNNDAQLADSALLASGMLAIFWLVSPKIRSRNVHPNLRVVLWAVVAAVSALFLALR